MEKWVKKFSKKSLPDNRLVVKGADPPLRILSSRMLLACSGGFPCGARFRGGFFGFNQPLLGLGVLPSLCCTFHRF